MSQHVLDQMARNDATKAIALIESHERVCTERQGAIINRLTNIERLLGRVTIWAVAGAGTIIMSLLGLCAYLVNKVMFP